MPLFREHPDGSYRSHNCTIVGDVTIGRQSSVWFNTVIRGDVAPVTIGSRVNVQDQAVIHCDTGVPNIIEDDVVIGHSAIVHGKFVGRGSLIGMAATLLRAMFVPSPGSLVPQVALVMVGLTLAAWWSMVGPNSLELRYNWGWRGAAVLTAAFGACVAIIAGSRESPFLYFQF